MNTIARTLVGFLLTTGMAAPSAAITCSPTLFVEALDYPTGSSARIEAIGDFNGDLHPDVAAAGVTPRSISVLLNDGNGNLAAPIVTMFPDDPVAIAAADLRGNGTTDLVVANYYGVYVLLGHGDGTFDDPVFYEADTFNVSAVVIGAFDADPAPDVVVGSQGAISFFSGLGNGTFADPVLTTTFWPIVSMASGDFDTSGHLDIVASSGYAGTVVLYLGFGDGTFAALPGFIAGPMLTGLTTGDFNTDSHPDVAVGTGASVSILLGNGSGSFEAALLYPAGIDVGNLAAADLDQDGHLDLVAGETSEFYNASDQVAVLRGRGDGSFEAGEPYSSGGTIGIAVADLDDDSFPDVVTSGGSIFVLRDTADGSLLAVPNSKLLGPTDPNFARGDWNGDGRVDFAWVWGNQVLLIEGLPGGRFRQTGALESPGLNVQPFGAAAGHFFDSETWDIVVSTYNEVYLYRGNGDGTFQDPVSIFTGFNLRAIDAGNFDGRDHDDVVFGNGCCGSGSIVQLMNMGDGTFAPVETPFPDDPYDFLPAVLNAGFPPPGSAGVVDLVVVAQDNVWVLFSSNGGGFDSSVAIPSSYNAAVAVGNFDGGPSDLLISGGSASVSLYPNNGDGTFQPPVTIALSTNGGSVTTGYYNDDFETDFAVWSGGKILVFLGLGNAHFLSPIQMPSAIDPGFLVTASLAGSSVADIAALGQSGIAAFRNARLSARVAGAVVLTGSPAVLEARASGYGTIAYQWRKDGVPLSDGGPISGVQTPTLTIDPATFDDAGAYDVLVTDACTITASNSGDLAVEFADVPVSSPFHDDIIAIATAGITGGCGGADYCPTADVRRDQMAAFLLRSEHGSAYTPPLCTGVFADVPCPGLFTDWIEQLAAEGVTGGCGTGIYCPDQNVTRAQMAVFLLKTKEGSAYIPPPATGIFGDVPVGSFAADFIEDLYTRGITGGCSAAPLLYCPGSSVLRQQMATFLVRTFFP